MDRDRLLHSLKLLETAARRYVEGKDTSLDYLRKMAAQARAVINDVEKEKSNGTV